MDHRKTTQQEMSMLADDDLPGEVSSAAADLRGLATTRGGWLLAGVDVRQPRRILLNIMRIIGAREEGA
jgi:hypothetical protein